MHSAPLRNTLPETRPALQAEPFTAIPNRYFEIIPTLKGSEVKVLLYLLRQTAGWHRPNCTMGMRRLAAAAGVSLEETSRAVASLKAAGHITVETGLNRQHIYGLKCAENPRTAVREIRTPHKDCRYVKEKSPSFLDNRQLEHIPAAVSEGCAFSEGELNALLEAQGVASLHRDLDCGIGPEFGHVQARDPYRLKRNRDSDSHPAPRQISQPCSRHELHPSRADDAIERRKTPVREFDAPVYPEAIDHHV